MRIHQYVKSSVVPINFDNTSQRNQGKNNWSWEPSTTVAACFRVDANRRKETFQRFAS